MMTRDDVEMIARAFVPVFNEFEQRVDERIDQKIAAARLDAGFASTTPTPIATSERGGTATVSAKPRLKHRGPWERRPYATDDLTLHAGKAWRALCDHYSAVPPDQAPDCWRTES